MEDANLGAVTASFSVEQPSGFVSKELSTLLNGPPSRHGLDG